MFIVWGKKRVDTPLGYVADFCSACRQIAPFRLFRVGLAGHVYRVSLTKGSLLGHMIQCCQCQLELQTDPANYAAVSPSLTPGSGDRPVGSGNCDLPALISLTNPRVEEVWSERLALEQQIRTDPLALAPEARMHLISEIFERWAVIYQLRADRGWLDTSWDLPTSLGCLGTLLLTYGLIPLLFVQNTQDYSTYSAMVGGTLFLWLLSTANARWGRRQLMPQLIEQLQPLKPQLGELQAVWDKLKQSKFKLVKLFRPEALALALNP